MNEIRLLPSGDKAVSVEFGNAIDPQINQRIRAFTLALAAQEIKGITEFVPSYRSVMVHYRPEELLYEELSEALLSATKLADTMELPPATVVEIPVLYNSETGPDLAFVAKHCGKSIEEVIRIHTSADYLIYMLGFTPGFPYLGGMSKEIAAPRLTSPRVKIPGGSVGIAGEQTGVYPIDSPGGWQLIGRTPVKLYDPARKTPILLEAGQYIRFVAVDAKEYEAISAAVKNGSYTCKSYPKEEK